MQTIFSEPNPQDVYTSLPDYEATNQTKLIKWVLLSKTCPDIESNIKNLIETDPEAINKTDSVGCTPLIVACGNLVPIKIVKLLLDAGADTSLKCVCDRTALMIAAMYGNYEACELLIKTGIDMQDSSGFTPLGLAAWKNHQAICELLVRSDCNLNIQTTNLKSTALMSAASYGNESLCNILLAAGADPSLKNNNGKTAYDLATDSLKQLLKPKTKTLRIKYGEIVIEREIDFELDEKQLKKIMEILETYAK